MKIIHTADLHLDSQMTTHFKNDNEKARLRRQELVNTFRRLISYAVENKVEAVLIAGDLFDSRRVTKTTVNTVIHEITQNPDILFFYIKGNHDEESGIFQEKPSNLITFEDEWGCYELSEKVSIYGAEFSKENADTLCGSLVTDNQKINIAMLHGQESNTRGYELVCIPDLKNKGLDYLALGHIHSYKRETLDGHGIYAYPGCLEGRGFDEAGEKGFILLDLDEENLKLTDTFIPFASRKISIVNVDVTGLLTTLQAEEKIREELKNLKISEESMIKIVLVGQVAMESEFNTYSLNLSFKDEYFFVKVSDETRLLIDYDSFLKDMTLKGEFVRTLKEDSQLSDQEKAEIIRIGIGLLKGEQLGELL